MPWRYHSKSTPSKSGSSDTLAIARLSDSANLSALDFSRKKLLAKFRCSESLISSGTGNTLKQVRTFNFKRPTRNRTLCYWVTNRTTGCAIPPPGNLRTLRKKVKKKRSKNETIFASHHRTPSSLHRRTPFWSAVIGEHCRARTAAASDKEASVVAAGREASLHS